MKRLPPLPSVRELVRLYGLTAKKHLAQNFIFDMNVTERIVRSMGDLHNKVVLEVGPGPGSLTRSLLRFPLRHLIVVEKDVRFIPALSYLQEVVGSDKMSIVQGDILKVDEREVIEKIMTDIGEKNHPSLVRKNREEDWMGECQVEMVGNLPFNVSTVLLLKWLRQLEKREGAFHFGRARMTMLFQKEVADRIVAPQGSPNSGRLGVMTQQSCHAKKGFNIPGRVFVPPPKVSGSLVSLLPKQHFRTDFNLSDLEELLHYSFQKRRKSLRNSMKNKYLDVLNRYIEQSNPDFDLSQRPQDLSLDEWSDLASLLGSIKKEEGERGEGERVHLGEEERREEERDEEEGNDEERNEEESERGEDDDEEEDDWSEGESDNDQGKI